MKFRAPQNFTVKVCIIVFFFLLLLFFLPGKNLGIKQDFDRRAQPTFDLHWALNAWEAAGLKGMMENLFFSFPFIFRGVDMRQPQIWKCE